MIRAHPDVGSLSKKLAWFALLYGALTFIAPALLPLAFGQMLSPFPVVIYLSIGAGSMIGGYFGLAAKPWAYWLLFSVFLVQLVQYYSQSFVFNLAGPIAVKLGWGWNDPPSSVNINLLAFVVCVLAFYSAVTLTGRSDGVPSAPVNQ